MNNSETGTETPGNETPRRREAAGVKPGSVVILEIGEEGELGAFIKLERIGKEYIHHYAVQIHPRTDTPLGMVYLDPEDMVIDTCLVPVFDYGKPEATTTPEVGHAFANARGVFIKVEEDPKSQKMHGFVEPASGVIKRREERAVSAVYAGWCASCVDNGKTITLDEVIAKFGSVS